DAIRLHSTMAIHDVSAVFHFAGDSERGFNAVARAAPLHDPRMPVVTARPAAQLRLAGNSPPPVLLGVARFGELVGGDHRVSGAFARTAIALITNAAALAVDGPARDFVPVRDAARACLALAEAVETEGRPLDYTFRTGWELTDSAMARLVADVL